MYNVTFYNVRYNNSIFTMLRKKFDNFDGGKLYNKK
jgi:hypothetical protein